jgi:hypothetical protein
MLFQQGALFSALSVHDNIAFPLRELHTLDESMITDLVLLKLAMVELEARHARLMPAELSGGMVKRVALARALSLEPELLVLDEPTAGLDPDRSENFVKLLRMLQKELGFTVVMVTHDPETLAGLATRLAVLADQRLVACGTAAEVFAVDHPFIRNFFQFRACCSRDSSDKERASHGESFACPGSRVVHPVSRVGGGALDLVVRRQARSDHRVHGGHPTQRHRPQPAGAGALSGYPGWQGAGNRTRSAGCTQHPDSHQCGQQGSGHPWHHCQAGLSGSHRDCPHPAGRQRRRPDASGRWRRFRASRCARR